jgi:hypothetical protein
VNSNYTALQLSAKKQMSHGLLFNVNYTWSHSIDEGSTWHSGATTANGGAAGEGYTTDLTLPGLDRGNSIYDIRHRVVLNYVYQLPGQSMKGVAGAFLGGWSYNGIWAFQTGAHWMPYAGTGDPANLTGNCSQAGVNAGQCINTGGDFNLDGGDNDRPDSSIQHATFSRKTWAQGWCSGSGYTFGVGCTSGSPTAANLPSLTAPCLSCTGTLGRNNFVGPGQWYADMTLAKTFTLTERFRLKFDANAFNTFNRTNFLLAVNGGGAHNTITSGALGQAAGDLTPRVMQFGLKLLF